MRNTNFIDFTNPSFYAEGALWGGVSYGFSRLKKLYNKWGSKKFRKVALAFSIFILGLCFAGFTVIADAYMVDSLLTKQAPVFAMEPAQQQFTWIIGSIAIVLIHAMAAVMTYGPVKELKKVLQTS